VNASRIDFASFDLSARELRDERRGIHRALLSGEVAELFQEPAPDCIGGADRVLGIVGGLGSLRWYLAVPILLVIRC